MNRNVKRILKDYMNLENDPIDDIKYVHDETNLHCGYAMVRGPKNTPYEYGNYFFKFDFPESYPFKPPKLTFITGDGVTRFNPNLYRNGYVCLSLLNTWRGEQWSSCQTIRTILITLQTILNENPLLNEPGILKDNPYIEIYNEIIEYKNIEIAILNLVNIENIHPKFKCFYSEIKKYFDIDKKYIYDKIKDRTNSKKKVDLYGMNISLNYKKIIKFLNVIMSKTE